MNWKTYRRNGTGMVHRVIEFNSQIYMLVKLNEIFAEIKSFQHENKNDTQHQIHSTIDSR